MAVCASRYYEPMKDGVGFSSVSGSSTSKDKVENTMEVISATLLKYSSKYSRKCLYTP